MTLVSFTRSKAIKYPSSAGLVSIKPTGNKSELRRMKCLFVPTAVYEFHKHWSVESFVDKSR